MSYLGSEGVTLPRSRREGVSIRTPAGQDPTVPPIEGPPAPAESTGRMYRLGPFHWISRSSSSPAYLAPMYLLVLIAVILVADAFSRSPIPPGVDPGHWLAASYSYVGLATSPDPANQAFVYSPLMFPFLGGLVRLTGNPLLAADAFGVGLFLLYGLSAILVARRFLVSGPLQVALVGLAVFCGTTLQMLFWGGYPNLLGFVCLNVTMAFLLLYVVGRRTRDGAVFFAMVGVTYFAHDLTFAVLVACVALSLCFLVLLQKTTLRFVASLRNLVGVVVVGGAIGGYTQITARLGVSHPSYYFSNPAAYTIDEVGEIFRPLAHAPAFLPAGSAVLLPPLPTALLLASAPLVALIALGMARRSAPGSVDTRLAIAGAWLAAALAVPGAGYLAHVDTDYSRFLYFLPFPFVLVVLAAIERAARPSVGVPTEEEATSRGSSPRPVSAGSGRAQVFRKRPTAVLGGLVFLVLIFVLSTVTLPVVEANQRAATATAHDQAFLDAVHWLKQAPPGNVLTVPSAARWTEALALRNAYTVGPVWLLFQPFQIQSAQETYWALASRDVVTNNLVALSYSGFATPVMSQAPMYTVYAQGIAFPILRVLTGSLILNATSAGSTQLVPLVGNGTPHVSVPAAGPLSGLIRFSSSVAQVDEVGQVGAAGSASILFVVTPQPGVVVHSLALGLANPPGESTTLATDSVTGVQYASQALTWQVGGRLGQYPYPWSLTTTVGFSEAPTTAAITHFGGTRVFAATFPDGNGSTPFSLRLDLATAGASNPTSGLPPVFHTEDLLARDSIHYLLWPSTAYASSQLTYYERTFGFLPVYVNTGWTILQR